MTQTTTNILFNIQEEYEIECLKLIFIGCIEDVQIDNNFNFIFKTTDNLKDKVEDVIDKIKSKLNLTKFIHEVTTSELDVNHLTTLINIPVTSIILPNSLTLNKQVKLTPDLFKEKMENIEKTCVVDKEIWVIPTENLRPEEILAIMSHTFSQTLHMIDFAEKIMSDIQQRLKEENKQKDQVSEPTLEPVVEEM